MRKIKRLSNKLLVILFIIILSISLFSETYNKVKRIDKDNIGLNVWEGILQDFTGSGNYIYLTTFIGVVVITKKGKVVSFYKSVIFENGIEGDIINSIYKNPLSGEIMFLTRMGNLYIAENKYPLYPVFNLRKYTIKPFSMAIDKEGRFYFSEVLHSKILVFSSDFQYLMSIGSKGCDESHLQTPLGIEVKGGKIYIADSSSHSVKIFSVEDGKFIKKVGTYEKGDNYLAAPIDVGLDSEGNIYVLDRYASKVKKFSKDGTFITEVKIEDVYTIKIYVEDNGNFWTLDAFGISHYEKQ